MLALGESGRFEFKQDAEALTPGVLAALANWVALDDDRVMAQVLVGVEEITDDTTGLVSGRPCGLPKGLDKAVARIQDVASKTRPIPVDLHIVEEAVATATPFVRLEVRPTMAPHFDDQGRRQTRQGRSTRALTDDELLQTYLRREAGSFAARFRQVSDELHAAVGDVSGQVDAIARAIDDRIATPIAELNETAGYAAQQASAAESAAEAAAYNVSSVEDLVEDVKGYVGALLDHVEGDGAVQIVRQRRQVWWQLTVDTWERTSARADKLVSAWHALLTSDIAIDPARNEWELRVWRDLLTERKDDGKSTLQWWEVQLAQISQYMEAPVYGAPELPDLRAELQADLDYALDNPESLTKRFTALLKP
jgi:hypothetical protein